MRIVTTGVGHEIRRIGTRLASSNDVPPEILAKLRPMGIPRPRPQTITTSEAGRDEPNYSMGMPLRQSEPTIVCHELDRSGVLHVLGGKFLKSSLCSSLGLLPRDVRRLDGTLKDQLPLILVRESALLVNIENIRAIIKHDGVILFEGMEMIQRMQQHDFLKILQNRLRTARQETVTSAPFEFIVLETILQRVMLSLQEEYDAMQPEIEELLGALESIVHWERLKVLLVCKKRVAALHERLNNIRLCIKELLESDADMADMYLSDKHAAKHDRRPSYAHEEMELLLESYLKMAEEISSRTQILISNMEATEDIANIALVGQRNDLVLLNLRLGMGTFAAGMGGFGASVLGMNLHSGFEHSPYAFWIVLGSLLTIASSSFVIVRQRMLRLLQRK
jgi:magnesium transporter